MEIKIEIKESDWLDPEDFSDTDNMYFQIPDDFVDGVPDLIFIRLENRYFAIDILDIRAVVEAFNAKKYS